MRLTKNFKYWRTGVVLLLLTGILLGSLACGSGTGAAALTDPFTASLNFFTVQGFARGYVPGQTYELQVTLRNDEKESWQGQYYVYLVDTKSIVLNIAQQPVNMSPESTYSTNLKMVLPQDFKEGAYGLAFVFPGRGVSITTIRVGGDQTQPAGPWPDQGIFPKS